MKKIIVSALVLGFVTVSSVNATPLTTNTVVTVVAQEETPVKPEDLPAGIKTTLAGDEYKDWSILTAHKTTKDGVEVYKINVKKGEETRLLKFKADGSIITE